MDAGWAMLGDTKAARMLTTSAPQRPSEVQSEDRSNEQYPTYAVTRARQPRRPSVMSPGKPDGAVARTSVEHITSTDYYCPQCDSPLMGSDKCYSCSWRSPDYVPPPKQWAPNPHEKAARWAVSGGCCFYCGNHIPSFNLRGLDHLLPQSRGGTHEPENLIPACRTCNSGKKTKTLEEYRAWLRDKRYRLNDYQLAWLSDLGCPITNDDMPEVVFAFEIEGWT